MRKFKIVLVMLISLGLTTSCDKPNVLTEYSQTDSDEALYIDAKKKMDDLLWQEAIDIMENDMSSGFRARRDVTNTLASAYAGKCGFIFFDLIDGLTNSPSATIFPYFMGLFAGKTLTTSACDTAITLMQSLGTSSTRTSDENLYLALLGITRIGTTLAAKLDSADHNGTIDSHSTVCNNNASGSETDHWSASYQAAPFNFPAPGAGNTHYLTDAEIKTVIVGLGLIFENTAALTASLGGGNSALTGLDSAKTACASAISAVTAGAVTTCEFTSTAAVPSTMVYAFRLMLQSASFGFSTCDISVNTTYATNIASYVNYMNSHGGMPPDNDHDGNPDSPPTMGAGYCCPSLAIPGI